eukprot:1148924-Pelagomonas_calceolata.AAC.1
MPDGAATCEAIMQLPHGSTQQDVCVRPGSIPDGAGHFARVSTKGDVDITGAHHHGIAVYQQQAHLRVDSKQSMVMCSRFITKRGPPTTTRPCGGFTRKHVLACVPLPIDNEPFLFSQSKIIGEVACTEALQHNANVMSDDIPMFLVALLSMASCTACMQRACLPWTMERQQLLPVIRSKDKRSDEAPTRCRVPLFAGGHQVRSKKAKLHITQPLAADHHYLLAAIRLEGAKLKIRHYLAAEYDQVTAAIRSKGAKLQIRHLLAINHHYLLAAIRLKGAKLPTRHHLAAEHFHVTAAIGSKGAKLQITQPVPWHTALGKPCVTSTTWRLKYAPKATQVSVCLSALPLA